MESRMKKSLVHFSLVLSFLALNVPSIKTAASVSQSAAPTTFERAKKYVKCVFGSSECSKKEIINARLWAAGGTALFLAAAAAVGIPLSQARRKSQELRNAASEGYIQTPILDKIDGWEVREDNGGEFLYNTKTKQRINVVRVGNGPRDYMYVSGGRFKAYNKR